MVAKKGQKVNPKTLENLEKGKNYFSRCQPSPEAKSRGQIRRAARMNLIATARTLFEKADILPQVVDNIKEEVENGQNKNAIELFKVIREPDEKNINIKGEVGVQKVYITPEEKAAVDKHIEEFINDDNT